jgi:four helix bundle protein
LKLKAVEVGRKIGSGEVVVTEQLLRKRTKAFALKVIELVSRLPKTPAARVVGSQLLRSGTSVGANYRAACRARSKAEFIAKMGIVEEEADESMYWLELITESGLLPVSETQALLDEAGQIVAMVVASINTAKRSNNKPRPL